MDDLLVTGNKPTVIASLVCSLGGYFLLKDLSPLNFFLSIKVVPCITSLFLFQAPYIREILNCTELDSANIVFTSIASKDLLKLQDGSKPTYAV